MEEVGTNMARTINRQPWNVRSLNYGDTGYKYFGYSDWKGKCTNKNFIGVDQETFEDCNNVYIDRDNILRSRPAMKYSKELSKGNTLQLYTFGPWRVYKLGNAAWASCKLVFTNDIVTLETESNVPTNCNIVLADEKIFVFANNYAKYVDTTVTPLSYKDATDLIYSPVTKLYNLGVEKDLEKPNDWSKTHRERYIWNRKTPTNLDKLVGKTVTVELSDEESKTITNFQKYQEYTIAKELYEDLDESYIYLPIEGKASSGTITRTSNEHGIPMLDVSKNNSVVRAKKTTKMIGSTSHTYYKLEYAIDGSNFSMLPDLPWDDSKPYDCYYIPKFSEDGTIIYLYTSQGILAISVLSESGKGNYRYATWTNLCTAYNIPTTNVFTEFGCAHMSTYNTFSVFTGIDGGTNVQYALFMVREGTLVSKANWFDNAATVAGYNQRHHKMICNTSKTVMCAAYKITKSSGTTATQFAIMEFTTAEAGPTIHYVLFGEPNQTPESIAYMVLRNVALYNAGMLSGAIAIPAPAPNYGKTIYLFKCGDSFADEKLTNDAFSFNTTSLIVAESDSSVFTQLQYLFHKTVLPVQSTYPIAVKNDYLYYGIYNDTTKKFDVYTTYISDNILFTETVTDKTAIDYSFENEAELSQYYISKGKTVYISSKGAYTNNDFEWYFSEEYVENFDYEVTALHPISTTEVAVFTENSIYYVVPTTITVNDTERVAYQYYKSRIPLGCNKGSDIVTSYDGKYTIFSTKRGLVAMSYQDFVNSTEQALTFLSDNISQAYFDWNKGAVKLTLYKYWLIVYRLDTNKLFVYDMRNSSWWPMQYGIIQQVIEIKQQLVVLSRDLLYVPDTGDDNYKDDFYGNISWSLKSQKLHFNAINYYKSISNITLSSVMDKVPDAANPFTCNMRVMTYRKIMDGTQAPETMVFYVDMIRTFVKKLNYMKIGQFQFEMLSDDDNAQQSPLSLTSIVVKYKTTGQVR